MRVRHATPEDADALRSMLGEYLKEEHEAGSMLAPGERSMAAYLGLFSALISRQSPGSVLIAEEGEEAIGFTSFYVQQSRLDLTSGPVAQSCINYVRPDHRRGGAASELIARKEDLARALGCKSIQTTIRAANSASLGLVGKAGYSIRDLVLEKAL